MGIYQRKQNGNWHIQYFFKGRRVREAVGMSKSLAQTVYQKRMVEIAEGKYLDKREVKRVRFDELMTEYIRLHASSKKSFQTHFRGTTKNLTDYFSNSFLTEITVKRIEDFRAKWRSEGRAEATINRQLAVLKHMFNKAIDWGMADQNPVRKVKLIKERNQRVRYLETEELARLLANSSERLGQIVLFAVNTGMRKGEIQNLKWRDIDIVRDVITVTETKNGEIRYIPVNKTVQDVLVATKKHSGSPYVFGDIRGGAPYNFRKAFETALKHTGIEDFRFHDLRHTFASHLAMRGVDLNTVRELLGHKSLDMTLRYSHLSKDHKMRAVALLDVGATKTPQSPITSASNVAREVITPLAVAV